MLNIILVQGFEKSLGSFMENNIWKIIVQYKQQANTVWTSVVTVILMAFENEPVSEKCWDTVNNNTACFSVILDGF
jgi:hypothetical protein